MSVSVWEAIFMLLILKIPIFYLCGVVWYAVHAEPLPPAEDAGEEAGVLAPITPCGWNEWKRGRRVPYGRRPRPVAPRLRQARLV
ncbi:MAG TPA: hypothetical protein VFV56_03850 [Gaiellaceae bacterium]|nr:hypothetical protein [Gaiellaceae bacterium]